MSESQAKEVLYNAVNIAISKGCYNLDETISIVDALRIVLVEQEQIPLKSLETE